ncbi:MAG: virulence RhuM family protein [Verrucomicrobiota bacterium]
MNSGGEIILYQTEDGQTRIDVRFQGDTVWLTQAQMAELFQTTSQNITLHIQNIYAERELIEKATCKDYLQVRSEGARKVQRFLKCYNLDVIISVGYRVKSHRGTQFRIWATQRLREYLIKGFVMDDARLKKIGGGAYFDELLERIRDIRSSEKVFYRKILDIYATSADYNPDTEISQQFFATVQNKMHWAAHGHTAAELIYKRVDASRSHMGLTSWSGGKIHKEDIGVAKNYLKRNEIEALNLIVSAYLDFAELQARNRRPMMMQDWLMKLDSFLELSEKNVLSHAGKISHEQAMLKANTEFEKFQIMEHNKPSLVEQHFEEAIQKIKTLTTSPKKKSREEKIA